MKRSKNTVGKNGINGSELGISEGTRYRKRNHARTPSNIKVVVGFSK